MPRQLVDVYLGLVVVVAVWLTAAGPYAGAAVGTGRAWYPATMVAAFAVTGWLAAAGNGNHWARGLIRVVSALCATAIVAAMAISAPAAG